MMKDKLTHNWGLKLASIVFSFVLWVIVTNINDPVIQYKINNVPVKFIHTDVVTSQGKVYEVLDESDVIDQVVITAARSIVDALGDQNVVAIADFNDLTMQDTINIRLSTNKYNEKLESIKGSEEEVKLKIENKKTISLAVKSSASGEVSEGYLLGDITTDRNLVKVSGPESVISTISRAGVDVTVTDFTSNISTDADIHLYDIDGNEVDRNLVTMNISSVKVNVDILQTKRIPLVYHVSGEPAEGYRMTGLVEGSTQTVLVAAKPSSLSGVQSINIPEEALNVTGQTENMMALIDVAEYLPSTISLADPNQGLVTVTVYIEPEIMKGISIPASNITITNVPEGYSAQLADEEAEYTVILHGLQEDVDSVDAQMLTAVIDVNALVEAENLAEFEAGKYQAEVRIGIDETKVRISEPLKVEIEIKED